MKKILGIVFLLFGGFVSVSWAVPVTLNGTYFGAGAVSILDGSGSLLSDNFTDESPPSTLPLFGDVSVISPLDSSATAFSIADQGVLVAGTDVAGSGEFVTAVTATNFSGSFVAPGGKMQLRLDFANDAFAGGLDSLTQALLNFSLSGNGNILFIEDFIFSGVNDQESVFLRDFELPEGVSGTFDIFLSSMSSDFGSAANNISSVGFRIDTVPEPTTFMMLIFGLGMLGLVSWKKREDQCLI